MYFSFRPSINFQENDIYIAEDDSKSSLPNHQYNDELEIPHSQLNIGRNIGKGAFGSVYYAYANNFRGEKRMEMAVKKLKSLYLVIDYVFDTFSMFQ